jgi:hypothetical protein
MDTEQAAEHNAADPDVLACTGRVLTVTEVAEACAFVLEMADEALRLRGRGSVGR